MSPPLSLLVSLGLAWWLIKKDVVRRGRMSSALWIPTIWVAIIGSRPISSWLGFGGGTSTMEGSPVDALVFFILIVAAFIILTRRGLNWSEIISRNWPIFLFYGFLLISILWANSTPVSFKRWVKEFGNIVVLLVILTDPKPQEAVRAIFVRCAYLLLPLSYVLIRYFPSLGRFYSSHGGGQMTGVTAQKNSLGVLLVVSGLIVLWDLLELGREPGSAKAKRIQKGILLGLLVLTIYLMHMSDSATSMVCLGLGASIILLGRLPFFRRRRQRLGGMALAAVLVFWVLDQTVGLKDSVVEGLGRDMTYTGRTDVWRELLNLHTDPLLGVGFMSFWDDESYQSKLPYWVARSSAHSGYMEEYLTGGWVGIFFVVVMFLGTGAGIYKALRQDGDYGAVRLAVFYAFLIVNFSESNIACMTIIGFLFLLAAIGHAQAVVRTNRVWKERPVVGDLHPVRG